MQFTVYVTSSLQGAVPISVRLISVDALFTGGHLIARQSSILINRLVIILMINILTALEVFLPGIFSLLSCPECVSQSCDACSSDMNGLSEEISTLDGSC